MSYIVSHSFVLILWCVIKLVSIKFYFLTIEIISNLIFPNRSFFPLDFL